MLINFLIQLTHAIVEYLLVKILLMIWSVKALDLIRQIKNIIEGMGELSKNDIQAINELLMHDEWGVALEHLCASIMEDKINISNEQFIEIGNIGEAMEMEGSLWEELKHLIR